MNKNVLNTIVKIVHNLKEEGFSGPTINTGSSSGTPGFSQNSNPYGPTAGVDVSLGKHKKPDGRSKIMRRLPPPYRKYLSNK